MRLTIRHLRLGSGLVLLTYISLHLINHALGIWSIDLAEEGLTWAMMLWQSRPGTVLLYGAAALHFALALRTIYERHHWRLPPTEWVRLWAGFSLPLLLIDHAVGTRVAASFYDFEPSYAKIVRSLFTAGTQGWQIALLAPGWLHGCLGLWISLRRFEQMRRLKPVLIGLVALVPALSAIGFVAMGRSVASSISPVATSTPDPDAVATRAALDAWRHRLTTGYLVLIIGTFAAGQLRNRLKRQSV
jgi:adenylate cyclase